jgi:hypothetical protein
MCYIVTVMPSALDDNREALQEQLSLRVSRRDLNRLRGLKERIPIASRNAIARTALRLGIRALEQDPTHALSENGSDSDPEEQK